VATADPTAVHVDTGDLRDYSQQIYDEAQAFYGSALGKGDFTAATNEATTHADVSQTPGQFVGAPISDSGMPASMSFWVTHSDRVQDLSDFSGKLSQSLEAITAASGAIALAYDSSDEVNADRIRNESGFFFPWWDTDPGTLGHERQQARITDTPAN
jgi:hypothetical protein